MHRLNENGAAEHHRLLILGCSARKRLVTGPTRAWDLYDGVAFRVVKRMEREACFPGDVDRLILSARYGLITPDTLIEPYNQRMTRPIAAEQSSRNFAYLRAILRQKGYQEVFLILGRTYLAAVTPFHNWLPPESHVLVAAGGLGQKLSQLKAWL